MKWESIKNDIIRATSGIIYSIWGGVGFSVLHSNKEINLIVWDKSYKLDDKKEVVNHKFRYDIENSEPMKSKHDIIGEIEKHLIENYT